MLPSVPTSKYPNLLFGCFGSERGAGPHYAAALARGQRDWAIRGAGIPTSKYPNLLFGYFGSERGTGPHYAAALAQCQRDWAIRGPKLVLPRLGSQI